MLHQPSSPKITKRSASLILLIAAIFLLYSVRLFEVQILDSNSYVDKTLDSTETKLTVKAARGEILDRNLRALATNRTTFSVCLDWATFPRGTSESRREQQNAIFSELSELLASRSEEWNDVLPLSATAPYTFAEGRENSVAALKSKLRLASYATADNCMQQLIERYRLQQFSPEKQRILAGIQYSLEVHGLSRTLSYTFAEDISPETAYLLKENSTRFSGVMVQASVVREYVNGDLASHLIGTVGSIYAEEYEQLKDQGYLLNDVIGKSGIEAAFESVLRGENGVRSMVRDKQGNLLKDYQSTPAQAGQSVVLTLDTVLQQAAQNALADKIAALRAQTPTAKKPWIGQDVKSGSVVVLDVDTGGVLTCASWPSYELASYYQNYNTLLQDPDIPLFNRALFGTFPNGSTMKPAITIAGLMDQIISPNTKLISCAGIYKYYAAQGYSPKCLGYHGSLNMFTALQKSCNVFFYELGRLLTIDRMNYYCRYFGLGSKTGIEIGEAAGVLAGPQNRNQNGGSWAAGETIAAAIGQSDNRFTPIQLASYAATLANNGVRYKAHLVHSILAGDGSVVSVTKPEILSDLDIPQHASDAVRQAMISVTQTGGTAAKAFAGAQYTVAAKTGTAQGSSSKQSDHGVFIAYAPAENPQVAIAVVMEQGTSAAAADVARQVLDAYFA